MPLRSHYGVNQVEVDRFVEENEAVKEWLGKYMVRTAAENSYKLCRFLKWLKAVKGMRARARAHFKTPGELSEFTYWLNMLLVPKKTLMDKFESQIQVLGFDHLLRST